MTSAVSDGRSTLRIPKLAVELGLLLLLYFLYSWVRNQVEGVEEIAVRNAENLINLQEMLGLNIEYLLNDKLHYGTALTIAACWFYAVFHFVVTPGVLIWLYIKKPTHYSRYRLILAVTTLIALAIFWLYPMAPPRLTPSSDLQDIMALNAEFGWWPGTGSAPESVSNQYAAMPSVHCLWALWCGVAIFHLAKSPRVRALGVLYPILTVLVVMATGHHFVLDAVVSMIILAVTTLVVTVVRWQRARLDASSRLT